MAIHSTCALLVANTHALPCHPRSMVYHTAVCF
jgi:hypothetical protein